MDVAMCMEGFNPLDRGNSNQIIYETVCCPIKLDSFNPLDRGNSNQMESKSKELQRKLNVVSIP